MKNDIYITNFTIIDVLQYMYIYIYITTISIKYVCVCIQGREGGVQWLPRLCALKRERERERDS
jgi:hypothetical protein